MFNKSMTRYCNIFRFTLKVILNLQKYHFESNYRSRFTVTTYQVIKMKRILALCLVMVLCYSQNPQPIVNNQDFIEPTPVNADNQIPAAAVNVNQQAGSQASNANGQTVGNTPPPQPTVTNTPNPSSNEKPSEGVLLSNANMHGLEGQAVPVDMNKINEEMNQPKQPLTPQEIAKAREQADKARQMAEEAKLQAQKDRQTRENREDEQLRNIQLDQTMSKTERKKQQERLMFRKIAREVNPGTTFTEYLFEQTVGSSEFFIKLPTSQQVAMNLYTYVAQDNTYIRTKNIEQEEPVKIYIYENNQNMVYQGEFYYQTYIIFEGQANAMYLIKVVNNGRTKLISMNCKKLLEEAHLQKTLQKNDNQHVERTQNLALQINRWYQQFRKVRMLDFQDLKFVEGYIEKFYSWEIVEIIVAIIMCLFQVKMIQNMLKGNTIV